LFILTRAEAISEASEDAQHGLRLTPRLRLPSHVVEDLAQIEISHFSNQILTESSY
jgi:hypothetical protein